MSKNPRSKSTATKENALDPHEIDQFLAIRQLGRVATNRGDGWWHVTPIWYLWEDGHFLLTLGASRRHLRNLRRDPHATLCVDRDLRLTEGPGAGAQSVVCFATAELSTDEELVRDVTERIRVRYLGDAYVAPSTAEARAIATLTPVHWLTWDYDKD